MRQTANLRQATPVMLVAALAATPALAQRGVQINTDALGLNIPGDAANEPSFAIDPKDPQNMVVGWRQFPTIQSNSRFAGYAVTTDGGLTWHNGGTLAPPDGWLNSEHSDPVLAADANGVFYYNNFIFRGLPTGQTVYRSRDGGFTWDDPFIIELGQPDKNWYAIDRDVAISHHYCVWREGDYVFAKRSTDEGGTWQGPQMVTLGYLPYIEVGLEGRLYLACWRPPESVVRVLWSDDARDPRAEPTWSAATLIDLGDTAFNLPVNPGGSSCQVYLAQSRSAGPTRGFVYVLSSARRSDDVCDVMFARSTDGGRTFSSPIRINDDPPGQDYQWMAAMSIAPSGRLDATWFDTRDDPNHFISRLYYSYSWDGGLTWSPNRAVGDPFDPSLGYPQQNKIGDYFQCQSDNGSVSVIYPATFNGEQDIYYQRLHPMMLETSPLRAGQQAQLAVSEARPGEQVWVVYSLAGRGYTNIGMLDVPVNLARPQLGVGPRLADQNGNVMWTVTMPPQSQGRTVWFQAIQRENASNVIEAVVE